MFITRYIYDQNDQLIKEIHPAMKKMLTMEM